MSGIRTLPKDERDRIRRGEIIEAAAKCMARHGFHQTSMSLVAREAGMSVGQMYRYFSGKDAIIEAVVVALTERRAAWISSTAGCADLASKMFEALAGASGELVKDRYLLLEIHAEAARNSAVAAILQKTDAMLRNKAVAAVCADDPSLSREEAAAIVEYMATFSEGRLLRVDKGAPDSLAGAMALHRKVMRQFLPRNAQPQEGI